MDVQLNLISTGLLDKEIKDQIEIRMFLKESLKATGL